MKKRNAVVFWMFLFTLGPLVPLFLTPLPTYSAVTGATPLFLPTILKSQPRYWIQNYWVNQNYVWPNFAEMELTSSGDMVLAGYLADGGSHGNGVLAKVEQNGQFLWLKRLNGTYDNQFDDVALPQDGSYWVSGKLHFDNSSYNYAPWLVRFDSAGSVLWQKTYMPTPFSRGTFTDILATPDNGLLVAIRDYFHGNTIAKINSDGVVNWARALNPAEDATIREIKTTPDGGYILVGSTYKIEVGGYEEYRAWVIKMNADGTVAWQRYYGLNGLDPSVWRLTHLPFSVVADSGGYTVAVHVEASTFSGNQTSLWVLRLHTNGNVIWQKSVSGVGDQFSDLVSTQDGGVVIVGSEIYPSGVIYRPWALKLDRNGVLVWQRLYNSQQHNWYASVSGVRETNAGDLIIVGRENYNPSHTGLMLIKMSSQGLLDSCSCLINNNATVAEPPFYYMEVVIDPGTVASLTPNNTAFSSTNVELQTARICPETTGPICFVP